MGYSIWMYVNYSFDLYWNMWHGCDADSRSDNLLFDENPCVELDMYLTSFLNLLTADHIKHQI